MYSIVLPALESSVIALIINSSIFLLSWACAINAFISSSTILLSFICSGTSPLLILCAKPKMMLDLPTPGSPIKSAFLFVILPSVETKFSTSSSCPIPNISLLFAITSLISLLKWLNMKVYPYIQAFPIPPVLKYGWSGSKYLTFLFATVFAYLTTSLNMSMLMFCFWRIFCNGW